MDYLKWNNIIAKYFFNETKSGREVFLYVNDDLINLLGKKFSCGIDDFIESIKQGPSWVENSGICNDAIQTFDGWRDRDIKYPPYIGYLAFFVLAAVTETDFSVISYYPGLWKRLDKPMDLGTPLNFNKMRELWDDLETWSRVDKREEIGRFVVRIRGRRAHVGIPLSQTLLSEYECKHLPNFFDLAELDPTDPPSTEVLCKLLTFLGNRFLQTRTQKLFYDHQKNIELRNALVQYIYDELIEWDGTVHYQIEIGDSRSRSKIQTGLRICLEFQSVAGTVKSYLRLKTKKMFPEEGLEFRYPGDNRAWYCHEEYSGWSQPLRCFDVIPPEWLDASSFDWERGVEFEDEEHHWHTKMKGVNTRLFRLKLDGLPHWVESQILERGIEFIVACYGEDVDKVIRWGQDCCEIFKEWDYKGIPSGWKLFYGKNAKESCPGVDTLLISSTTRLIFKGGIKAEGRMNYFHFAPPTIVLQNSIGQEKVLLNEKPLSPEKMGLPVYKIPKDTPPDVQLRIKVEMGDQHQHQNIWLVDFKMPKSFETPSKSCEGIALRDKSSSDSVCGSVIKTEKKFKSYPNLLPYHLSDRIVFIGENPGQIIDWPKEVITEEWHPVWAIAVEGRRGWKIHFCGTQEQIKMGNFLDKPISNKKDKIRWKKTIWKNRKKMKQPDLPIVQALWKKYEEGTKNV